MYETTLLSIIYCIESASLLYLHYVTYIPQCKLWSPITPVFIKDRAIRFACSSMGFSTTANRIVTTVFVTWLGVTTRNLSICLSNCITITFESLDVGSSYLHIRCISRKYGLSRIWRSSVQGQGHWSKKGKKFGKSSESVQFAVLKACDTCADMGQL